MPWRAPLRPALRRLIAVLIVFNGALDLILALVRDLPARAALLQDVLPLDVSLGSRTLTVVSGFALIMVGRGLARGKRHAWMVAFPLLLAVSEHV